MRPKTLRILIYLASALPVCAGGWIVARTLMHPPPPDAGAAQTSNGLQPFDASPRQVDDEPTLSDLQRVASAPLRQRLFDPPPAPPPQVVEKVVPPPRVKLIGTMINARQPSALIADERGNVEIKKVGESVGPENNPAIIRVIASDQVTLEHRGVAVQLDMEQAR